MSVFCAQGHENPDGSMFCDQCGEALSASAATSGASYNAAPDATSPGTGAGAPMTPAPASVAAKLMLKDGTVFPLEGKSEFLVGREDPVSNIYPDIDLTEHRGEEDGVSRMHAKIYAQGSQYLIEDLNSTNATYLNRQKLAAKTPTQIKDGDEVRFGKVEATFATA